MKPEVHAIVTAVNELTRQMAVDADRIEQLEAALRQYACNCAFPCDEHLTDLECGLNARKALEGKDD